ncbi:hypothetical protein KC19_6G189600 [Ceratodon purpureus]|uniref:Uncharacterized protein n=1 Tax=Ceratodon purpureus TaxID=3225 RepID=A0A8T0HJ51_CERPU|nr:hypothetical protein KC19_6G189600 [Ceratodon purpureus]
MQIYCRLSHYFVQPEGFCKETSIAHPFSLWDLESCSFDSFCKTTWTALVTSTCKYLSLVTTRVGLAQQERNCIEGTILQNSHFTVPNSKVKSLLLIMCVHELKKNDAGEERVWYANAIGFQIVAFKDHWSEFDILRHDEDENTETDLEIFRVWVFI